MSKQGVEITREEFYELLWAEPLKALVERFGSDYSDLAALAEKHHVPRPPKGYWTKREMGAPSSKPPLPESSSTVLNSVFILSRNAEREKKSVEQARYDALVGNIELSKDLKRAHYLVTRWVDERKRSSRALVRTSRHSDRYFEYCDTDNRRHLILETLIRYLEKIGGKIQGDHDEKWIEVRLNSARIEFRVREVLRGAWLPLSERERNLSYNNGKSHQSMLEGSGIICLHLSGRIGLCHKVWSDSPGKPIERHLKQIAATFLITRDQILQYEREEAARRQRTAEQQAVRRAEAERRQREDNRWACLVDLSKRANEVESIRRFLDRLERCGLPMDHQAGERTVAEWMAWAREQIRLRDPLADGAGPAFDQLAAI